MGDLQLPGFMRRDFRVDFILDSDHPVPIVRNKQVDEFSCGSFLFGLIRYETLSLTCAMSAGFIPAMELRNATNACLSRSQI